MDFVGHVRGVILCFVSDAELTFVAEKYCKPQVKGFSLEFINLFQGVDLGSCFPSTLNKQKD